jgi:hypothetical protein
LPRLLISSLGVQVPIESSETSFEAIVVKAGDLGANGTNLGLPVIALKPELISLKDDLTNGASSLLALVESVSSR